MLDTDPEAIFEVNFKTEAGSPAKERLTEDGMSRLSANRTRFDQQVYPSDARQFEGGNGPCAPGRWCEGISPVFRHDLAGWLIPVTRRKSVTDWFKRRSSGDAKPAEPGPFGQPLRCEQRFA